MPLTKSPISLLVLLLLIHALLTAAVPTPGPQTHQPRNESSASPGGSFAEFTRPRKGDTLVTGSVAEVRWEAGKWDGTVMLEVAEGHSELKNFVYVDCESSLFPSSRISEVYGRPNRGSSPKLSEPGPRANISR